MPRKQGKGQKGPAQRRFKRLPRAAVSREAQSVGRGKVKQISPEALEHIRLQAELRTMRLSAEARNIAQKEGRSRVKKEDIWAAQKVLYPCEVGPPSKKSEFSQGTIRGMMREAQVTSADKDAADMLSKMTSAFTRRLSKTAARNAKHRKGKRIQKEDVELAQMVR